MNFKKTLGKDLKVGDRIAPWGGRITTITGLTPYVGRMAYLWGGKAQIATFENKHPGDEWKGSGMTIDPNGSYDKVEAA